MKICHVNTVSTGEIDRTGASLKIVWLRITPRCLNLLDHPLVLVTSCSDKSLEGNVDV